MPFIGCDIDIGIKFVEGLPIKKLIRKLSGMGYLLERTQLMRFNLRQNLKYGNIPSFYSFKKYDTNIDVYLFFFDEVYNRYVGGRKYTVDKKLLDKFDTLTYNGIKFNIPSPTEDYLEYRYGKDWRTPNPDWEVVGT